MWPILLVLFVIALISLTAAQFIGSFNSYVPVTLSAERAGLVMESCC